VEAILEALLESAEAASVVETSGAEENRVEEKETVASDESEREKNASDDDDARAARVEALVAEMSATESRGSALIGAEAFGGLYDALARRAEAAAAAAAAMRERNGLRRAPFGTEAARESDFFERFDSSGSESESDGSGSSERWTPTKRNVLVFSEKNARTRNENETWSATLGPFASSVTVAMTPRRDAEGTKKQKKNDVTFRFAEAEVLALRYARLVSELEKVGRSREGTPEDDARDCALGLAAGGPTGK